MQVLGPNGSQNYAQKKLGQILLEGSLIEERQLQTALSKQQRSKKRLGEILVKLGYSSEELILNLLGRQLQAPYVKLAEIDAIDRQIARYIPESFAHNNMVFPLKLEDQTLSVAMADPSDQFLKNVLSLLTGYQIKSYIASAKELRQAISKCYSPQSVAVSFSRQVPTGNYFLPLKQLGFTPGSLQLYKKHLDRQKGCILITGPANSGKKTTLYSSLRQLNYPDNDIMSIEKKVNYNIEGINQLEWNQGGFFDQEKCLKLADNFNPSIVGVEGIMESEACWQLVGEIAEKGSMVIATINCEQNMYRFLTDLAAKKLLRRSVLENLELVVRQKVAHAICPYCKTSFGIKKSFADKIGIETKEKEVLVYKGAGCKICGFSGYLGLTGCYQVLPINEKIKEAIMQNSDFEKIKRKIKKEVGNDFNETLQEKLLEGTISLEEYLQLQGRDWREFKEIKNQKLADIFWQMFEKSGSVNSYLAFRGKA